MGIPVKLDSKLQILPLSERNYDDWNRYVSNHPQATPYHNAAWQVATKSAYNMQYAGLVAIRVEDNSIVGVAPAIKLKSWFLGERLCALPYCDVGFPIADSDEIAQYLVSQLSALNPSAKYIEVRDCFNGVASDPTTLVGKKVQMRLALPESSDVLLKSFKSKLRSQIKKADKNGLTSREGNSLQLISDFYSVYSKNMRDLGSPVHSLSWFVDIANNYATSCFVNVVYYNDIPIGAGIVLKNREKASIPWASTLREFNKLAPNMKLYWNVLAHCADSGIREFDFGRSTFNEGTFKFKKQWGAQPYLLDWYGYPRSVSAPQNNEAAEDGFKAKIKSLLVQTWRMLPLKFTVALGSKIRPHISL